MMELDEKLRDPFKLLQFIINVQTKFHGSPTNGCLDISLKSTNVNLMFAQ